MTDLAIIGTGPAGVSAALTAKARDKDFLFFGSKSASAMLGKAHLISNYPGFTGSGQDLANSFFAQLEKEKIEITEKRVTNIYAMKNYFSLLSGQEQFDARSVILATGVDFGKPIEGEEKFLGRGVSYCATCDGMLFKGQPVAVISYSKNEEGDANFLADICSKVYYLPQYKDEVKVDIRCTVINEKPIAITGNLKAEQLQTSDTILDVACVFILRESISPTALIAGLSTEDGRVVVDRNMATNIPGLFACGDITGSPFQIAKAVGEGNVAALSAVKFLSN